MTKIETRIANYFLDNMESVCLETATDLARKIGVSDSSIIRLTRSLGYGGFAEFQKRMKSVMAEQFKSALLPSEKYKKTSIALKDDDLAAKVLSSTFENLTKTFDRVDMGEIERICSILRQSVRKYIFGFRGSAGLATFFGSRLTYLAANVETFLRADSSVIERAVDFTERDCLVLFSFPVYTSVSMTIIDIAKERGTKIIVVTDKVTSPVASKADVVITVNTAGLGFSNSYVAPLAVIDLILLNMSKSSDSKVDERIDLIDKYIGMHDMY